MTLPFDLSQCRSFFLFEINFWAVHLIIYVIKNCGQSSWTSSCFYFIKIVVEEFLEDINNILNSGEVPNLFEPEEYEMNIVGCRPAAKEVGIAEGNRDGIYEFFINRVRYGFWTAFLLQWLKLQMVAHWHCWWLRTVNIFSQSIINDHFRLLY